MEMGYDSVYGVVPGRNQFDESVEPSAESSLQKYQDEEFEQFSD